MQKEAKQREILERHLSGNDPLFKKGPYRSTDCLTQGASKTVSSYYGLMGTSRCEEYPYLPYFRFSVGLSYHLSVPVDILSRIEFKDMHALVDFKLKDGNSEGVTFKPLKDLFSLRNQDHRLSHFLDARFDQETLPFDESNFEVGYSFYAGFHRGDCIEARVDVDHEHLEDLMGAFLSNINHYFYDFNELSRFSVTEWGSEDYQAKFRKVKDLLMHVLVNDLRRSGAQLRPGSF